MQFHQQIAPFAAGQRPEGGPEDSFQIACSRIARPPHCLRHMRIDGFGHRGCAVKRGHEFQAAGLRLHKTFESFSHRTAVRNPLRKELPALGLKHNITKDATVAGVVKGEDGEPNGEIQETRAMALAESALTVLIQAMGSKRTIRDFGNIARQVRLTCIGDLGGTILTNPASLDHWRQS